MVKSAYKHLKLTSIIDSSSLDSHDIMADSMQSPFACNVVDKWAAFLGHRNSRLLHFERTQRDGTDGTAGEKLNFTRWYIW